MRFADKLSFLLHLTETSNKDLAAALSVNPSLISLLRTGKRDLPKNPAYLHKMAAFFARHSAAEFKRHALSEMLNQASISPTMPTDVLTTYLENWLRGDSSAVDEILEGIHTVPQSGGTLEDVLPFPAIENQTAFFYGEEGRREVMKRVMAELQSMETPRTILAVIDDNLEWLLSDYMLTNQMQANLLELMERGFTFYQIMPPLNFINRYAESLKFWLPMYATGQMKVYYYPRLRGNLYRHSIIVIPDRCVQYSSAVGLGSSSEVTMLSTNFNLVKAYQKQFQELMSLCRIALKAHQDTSDTLPCYLDFLSQPGDTIQLVNTPSVSTMPPELLDRCCRETENPELINLFQANRNALSVFEEKLKQNIYIDMTCLASANEVRSGKVCITSALTSAREHLFYTPETYVVHLKNILRLMDEYENYYFLPLPEKQIPNYNLFVNENGIAYLFCAKPPFRLLEMFRPEMVMACRENLLRKAESFGYDGIHKEKIRRQILALIQELSE